MKNYKVIAVLIALMAIPLISSSSIVIGDFEGSLDGWGPAVGNLITNSTAGVTLGLESLEVYDSNGGWSAVMEKGILGSSEAMSAILQPGAAVSIDLTKPASGWFQMALLINCDGYWQNTGLTGMPSGTGATVEFALSEADQAAISSAVSYANIGFLSNSGAGIPITYQVDNIQIIPEPGTLCLIAVFGGGIAFVRRLSV